MPELSRFYNIVIKMIYADNGDNTTNLIFMYIMQNTKHQ